MRAILVAPFLFLAAGQSLGQQVTGIFSDDCTYWATRPDADDAALEVREGRIETYFSYCTLNNPVAIRDLAGAELFDADCWDEGTTRAERLMLMPRSDGGLIMVGTGFSRSLTRCAD